jgi:hypothetical protein
MEQTRISYEKRKINLKRQVDRRRYELGVPAIRAEADVPLLKEVKEIVPKTNKRPLIQFFDFCYDFEDEEKTSLDLYQKRASKLWQNLF